jgi:hypothetical protein
MPVSCSITTVKRQISQEWSFRDKLWKERSGGGGTSYEQEAALIIRLDIICASVIIYRPTLYYLHCIVLCIVSPVAHSCLFPIFVQVYRPLPPNGKPITVNKYHMYNHR